MSNRYGDVELDAQGMRALAHPVRLAILTRLQDDGPATATQLAPHVKASPSVTSWHLRHLAEHGLVRDSPHPGSGRERWWEAASSGFRFQGDDADSIPAGRLLTQVIEQVEGDIVGAWRAEVEPRLKPEWSRLAGRANTTFLATAAELAEIEESIETLLAPYVLRKQGDASEVPAGARLVRQLRYVMPSADESGSETAASEPSP